ncbi:MAG: polysaccharide deacetylase family protein [Kineosporiaceae bacterium]|nr:polysaccharide deacetylase family protein [Kineosporiaceae bacterium]
MTASSAPRLPILMYHSIPAHGPGSDLAVPVARLRDQLLAVRDAGWTILGQTAAWQTLRRDPTARLVALTFDDGYEDFLGALPVLAEVGASASLYLPVEELDRPGFLTRAQVDELPPDLVEIGSHARRHMPLDLLDPRSLEEQVQGSRDDLEQLLVRPVVSFCYPNGYVSPRVRRAVAAAGYTNACIVGRRVARRSDDPLRLPRLQVTAAHSGADVLHLLQAGEGSVLPMVKRLAQPAWRVVRRTVHRTTGKVVT